MTAKKFYDWQTAAGTDDVMLPVNSLNGADIQWCAIGGVAVNHCVGEPTVTQDVDFVVATDDIERSSILKNAGFHRKNSRMARPGTPRQPTTERFDGHHAARRNIRNFTNAAKRFGEEN